MFKAVRRYNNEIHSLYSQTHSIQYTIGEWVKPKIGKIFVFDTYKHTLVFLHSNFTFANIYECEVLNPFKLKYRSHSNQNFEYFWSIYDKLTTDHIDNYIIKPPTGTYVCDAV